MRSLSAGPRTARFALPPGVDELTSTCSGSPRTPSPLPADGDRSLIISPFVSDDFFTSVRPAPVDELVSRPESLDLLDADRARATSARLLVRRRQRRRARRAGGALLAPGSRATARRAARQGVRVRGGRPRPAVPRLGQRDRRGFHEQRRDPRRARRAGGEAGHRPALRWHRRRARSASLFSPYTRTRARHRRSNRTRRRSTRRAARSRAFRSTGTSRRAGRAGRSPTARPSRSQRRRRDDPLLAARIAGQPAARRGRRAARGGSRPTSRPSAASSPSSRRRRAAR